jgi:hypothetical protein
VFGGFFGGVGLLLSTLAVVSFDRHAAAAALLGPFGLVAILLGLLSLRSGFLSRNRILVDGAARVVHLTIGAGRSLTVDFDAIEAILARLQEKTDKARRQGRSTRSYRYFVYQVYILSKGGDRLMVDESTAQTDMMSLAQELARRCGVPFVGSSQSVPSPQGRGIGDLRPDEAPSPPRRVRIEDVDGRALDRWWRASWPPLHALLYLATAWLIGTVVVGCAFLVRAAFQEGDPGFAIVLAVVSAVFLYPGFLLARFCLTRCELRIDDTALSYRTRLLGVVLERHEASALAIGSLRLNCAGNGRHAVDVSVPGQSWSIELRDVSLGDVAWLQQRWAEKLGLGRVPG